MDEGRLKRFLAKACDEDKREEYYHLYHHLEMLCPAFGVLKKDEAIPFMDKLNGCLSETPFMLFLFGDGIGVASKLDMYNMAKTMFNADTFSETRG